MRESPEPRGGPPVARHVFVSGRVQGVSYRWHCVQEARGLGVSGWVRNLDDGRVEAHVQGDATLVNDLVTWMRTGPRGARVESLTEEPATVDPALRGFVQR